MNCPKCGAVLNMKCKYCLRCGVINQYYQGYEQVTVPIQNGFQNTNNNVNNVSNTTNNNVINVNNITSNNINNEVNVIDNNQFDIEEKSISEVSKILCIVFNILFLVLLLYLSISAYNDLFTSLLISFVSSFYFICIQLLLIKARLPWWGLLIPIYNVYIVNKLCFGNGWLFLLPTLSYVILLITASLNSLELLKIVSFIVSLITGIYPFAMIFCLGRRFGRSGLFTLLLPGIVIPSIALSKKFQYEDY